MKRITFLAGSQQYAATWAGDTGGAIDTIPYMTNMAFCGHTNTSCDMDTNTLEGIHFGFLMPWSMLMSWRRWHQPWFLGKELESAIRDYSKLRSSLFPYIYSMAHKASQTGLAIARPLQLMYEDSVEFDDVDNMYMFGDSLLVGAFDMNLTLPEGKWYDWFTGDVYEGGSRMEYKAPKGKGGALLMKEGSVVVTQPPKDFLDDANAEMFIINVFPGNSCEFDMFEDDGESYDYLDGGYGVTKISVSDVTEKGFTINISKREIPGAKDISLEEITDFEVKIFAVNKPCAVTVNSGKVAFEYNEEAKMLTFVVAKAQREAGDVACAICNNV